MEPLPPLLAKIATESLNETPGNIQSGLEILKKWIDEQPYLIARTDEKFLLAFLRHRKHNVELAKERLDKYYSFRLMAPEVYKNRDPTDPKMKSMFQAGMFTRLPANHPDEGSRIIIYRPKVLLETKTYADDLLKCGVMCLDYICTDEYLSIAGARLIFDLSGLSFDLKLVTSFTLSNLKKWVTVAEECYPFIIKGFHIVNYDQAPQACIMIVKTILRLINEKMKNRVIFHDDLKSLHAAIPPSILPKEYGGMAGPLFDILEPEVSEFLNSKKWFEDDQQYGTDESKRLEKLDFGTHGAQGSFRKLNVD